MSRYPWPKCCVHDNGGEFVGWEFQQFLDKCNVTDMPTTIAKIPRFLLASKSKAIHHCHCLSHTSPPMPHHPHKARINTLCVWTQYLLLVSSWQAIIIFIKRIINCLYLTNNLCHWLSSSLASPIPPHPCHTICTRWGQTCCVYFSNASHWWLYVQPSLCW